MESPISGPQTWGTPASEAPVVDKARIMDKAWEQVQKKTFTKWVNTKLRERQLSIEDLTKDLCDGVMLIHLLEIIGHADVGRYYKAPKMRIQKMENCNTALAFIKKRGVNLTNIGAEDIVDASEKLILGMIWTIILRFTIADIREEGQNSKDGLLLWCQRRTQGYAPDVHVRDFHNSWNDGLAFCALIHRHRPDLLDFHTLDKTNSHGNCSLAFEVAERDLGIPKLLDVEDVVDLPKPDERSLMTYVAQFFHTFSSLEKLGTAGRRVAKFAEVVQSVFEMRNDYERRARKLMDDISALQMEWDYATFDGTYADAKGQSNAFAEYKKNTKRSWVSEKRELENMLGNIQTKLKTYNLTPYNPPEGYKPVDVEQAWQRLISREVKRKRDIRAKVTEIKQALQDEFSQLANSLAKKLAKITQQHSDINADGEPEDQLNIYRSALEQVESLESVELIQVVESEFRCLEANIEEVEDTVYTADDLAFEIAQAKQSLQKKCNFLENQIVARGFSNLQPEQLEEFEAAFRHFAKETSNSLTKSEFLSCLQALGVALTDEEFEQVFSQSSSNKVFVNFEQFTNYMVSITEDRTTSDQLRSAFQDLATNKVNTINSANVSLSVGSQQLSLPTPLASPAHDQRVLSVKDLQQSFEDLQCRLQEAELAPDATVPRQAANTRNHYNQAPDTDNEQTQGAPEEPQTSRVADAPLLASPTAARQGDQKVEGALGRGPIPPQKSENKMERPLTTDKTSRVKAPIPSPFHKSQFSDRALDGSPPVRQRSQSFTASSNEHSDEFRTRAFSDRVFNRTAPVRQRIHSFTAAENEVSRAFRPRAFSDQVFKRVPPVRRRALSFSATDDHISFPPSTFSDRVFKRAIPVRQRALSFTAGVPDLPSMTWRITDPKPSEKSKQKSPCLAVNLVSELPNVRSINASKNEFDQAYFKKAFSALLATQLIPKQPLFCDPEQVKSPEERLVFPVSDRKAEMGDLDYKGLPEAAKGERKVTSDPKVDTSLKEKPAMLAGSHERSADLRGHDSTFPANGDQDPLRIRACTRQPGAQGSTALKPESGATLGSSISEICPLPRRLTGRRRAVAVPSRGHLISEDKSHEPDVDSPTPQARDRPFRAEGAKRATRESKPNDTCLASQASVQARRSALPTKAPAQTRPAPAETRKSRILRPGHPTPKAKPPEHRLRAKPLGEPSRRARMIGTETSSREKANEQSGKGKGNEGKPQEDSSRLKPSTAKLNLLHPAQLKAPKKQLGAWRHTKSVLPLSRGEEAFLSYLVLIILLIASILTIGLWRSVAIAMGLVVVGAIVHVKMRMGSKGTPSPVPRPLDLSWSKGST